MSKDEAYLRAIVREIGYLPSELKGYGLQKFIKSDKTKKAVCMTLLNIGEAANKLSKAFRDKYNIIPWHNYIGFRNIAAHNYDALKIERVWNTCKNVMPRLKKDIRGILEKEFGSPE